MARTIESMLENHRAASERLAAGWSPWDYTISMQGIYPGGCDRMPDELTDEQAADLGKRYALAIRNHGVVCKRKLLECGDAYDATLDGIVELLENVCKDPNTGDPACDELDERLDELYDWADANRVWITLR